MFVTSTRVKNGRHSIPQWLEYLLRRGWRSRCFVVKLHSRETVGPDSLFCSKSQKRIKEPGSHGIEYR